MKNKTLEASEQTGPTIHLGLEGTVPHTDVRLSGALAHYELLLPDNRDQLVEAVRASLHVLDIAPNEITLPVLAAVYRAVIRPAILPLAGWPNRRVQV